MPDLSDSPSSQLIRQAASPVNFQHLWIIGDVRLISDIFSRPTDHLAVSHVRNLYQKCLDLNRPSLKQIYHDVASCASRLELLN